MSNFLVSQNVNGRRGYITLEASQSDVDKIVALMTAGTYQVLKGGDVIGTATTAPDTLNTMSFKCVKYLQRVGKQPTISRTFKVPHLKATKNADDVTAALVGSFDASFSQDIKCTHAFLTFESLTKGESLTPENVQTSEVVQVPEEQDGAKKSKLGA